MLRTVFLVAIGIVTGGVIAASVAIALRDDEGKTAITSPDIANALRSSSSECPDKRFEEVAGTMTVYTLIPPFRGKSGDWYTGCSVSWAQSGPGSVSGHYSKCYRVVPNSLELVELRPPADRTPVVASVGPSCDEYPGWGA